MKVGIDIDSTVCESMPVILEQVRRITGVALQKKDVVEWNLVIDGTTIGRVILDFYREKPWMLTGMDTVLGAVEGVANLRRENEVIFITSRHDVTKTATKSWVTRHFGDAKVIHTGPTEDKTKNDFDMLIDDGPSYAEEFAATSRDVLLFDQPWNQKVKESRYITRVKSWKDITRLIG